MVELIRGRYEPVEVVGRGGQGEVLSARDHQHDRLVAIKICNASSAGECEALLQEAGILLGVRPHPNLPLVRDDFIDGTRSFVVMDWIAGRNLSTVLKEEGTPGLEVARVLDYVDQAADALDHLHDHDPPVVHRDVKPSNLILTPDGRIVLVDFGISRRWGSGEKEVGGTAQYAAPEILSGTATPASDVYSLGATAFALLTGDRPRPEVRPRIPAVPEHVAEALLKVLRRALAVDPRRRHPSAKALAEALRAATLAMPEAPARRKRMIAIAAGVFAVLAAAGYLLVRPSGPKLAVPNRAVVVGENPAGLAVNVQTNRIYVANLGSRDITVIDGASMKVTATINVSSAPPEAIAVNARASRLYVANGDGTVSVVDTDSNALAATIDVGSRPQGIGVNPKMNRVYVATDRSGVAVIDGATSRIIRRIDVTSAPRGIAVNPDASLVYVAGEAPNELTVIDGQTNAVRGRLPLGEAPCGLAVSHRENLVYVAGHGTGKLFVIDGTSRRIVDTAEVRGNACGVVVSPNGRSVYVGHDDGSLSLVDRRPASAGRSTGLLVVQTQTESGLFLNRLAVDPSRRLLYLVDKATNRLLVFTSLIPEGGVGRSSPGEN